MAEGRDMAKAKTNSIYCKSLKYSGNNNIAIIALCPYALLYNPCFFYIKFIIELAAAVPVYR